jgi:hypothetical protein
MYPGFGVPSLHCPFQNTKITRCFKSKDYRYLRKRLQIVRKMLGDMRTGKLMNIYDVDLTAAMRRSQSLAFATTGISMRPMAFFAISGLDVLDAQEKKNSNTFIE